MPEVAAHTVSLTESSTFLGGNSGWHTHSAAGATNSVQQQSVVIPVWPQRQVPEIGGWCLRISSSTTVLFGNRDRDHGVVLTMEVPQFQLSTVGWTFLFGNRDRYHAVVLTMEVPQIQRQISDSIIDVPVVSPKSSVLRHYGVFDGRHCSADVCCGGFAGGGGHSPLAIIPL